MKTDNINLTIEELDSLARAYLDCRMTKLEEKELELVLLSTGLSTPAIDEARETMGIVATIASPAKSTKLIYSRRRQRWLRPLTVAASIAIVAAVAIGIFNKTTLLNDNSESYTVYVNGNRLSGDLAQQKALQTQAECMKLLETTTESALSVQKETIDYLNFIQNRL
ncbi:MAG: hypothetical protein K2H61_03825 [Muribaculaceae bacterium]|nr:hypothetical protein [Muribaculaceae bacterium]